MKRITWMRNFFWIVCVLCLVSSILSVGIPHENQLEWVFSLLGCAVGSAVLAFLTGCFAKDVQEETESLTKRIRELEKELWEKDPKNHL